MNEKQAFWRDPVGMYGSFTCSACGEASGEKTRYCQHCGARMENFTSECVQDAEAGKADGSAFDGVNWKWLLPLLLLPFASDPPRRGISVTANVNGKSVVITYDPHDPEAAKVADVWRKALFAEPPKDAAPITAHALNMLNIAVKASNPQAEYYRGFRNALHYAAYLIGGKEPQYEGPTWFDSKGAAGTVDGGGA